MYRRRFARKLADKIAQIYEFFSFWGHAILPAHRPEVPKTQFSTGIFSARSTISTSAGTFFWSILMPN